MSFASGKLVGLPAHDKFCLGGGVPQLRPLLVLGEEGCYLCADADRPLKLCAAMDLHAAEQVG